MTATIAFAMQALDELKAACVATVSLLERKYKGYEGLTKKVELQFVGNKLFSKAA